MDSHWSQTLNDIYISIDDILKSISKLPNTTSCCSDVVLAIFIKCYGTPQWKLGLSPPMELLNGNWGYPPLLKEAIIIPILKPDSPKNEPSSYRPLKVVLDPNLGLDPLWDLALELGLLSPEGR